jgi:hypothetical protein
MRAGAVTADRLLQDAAEATQEPEHHENNQDQSKNAAEPGPAIAIVTIVATNAAQQQNQQDNSKDRAHC